MPDLTMSRQEVLPRHQDKMLIGSGPRSNEFQVDKQRMTMSNSLFQAVIKGNINKVRRLLKRGVNVNCKNEQGHGPLVASLYIDDPLKRSKMFQLLLDRGASHRTRDDQFKRPVLHWAAYLGQCQQVSTLLEEVAGDLNLLDQDREGYTALHHAVKVGSLPMVQLLVNFHVRFGVTVDTGDSLGLTPYLHAKRLGYRDVAALLREQGQASAGHGDHLFRSPREWSQIGKFERQKAIELKTQSRINAAKIMGKANLIRYLEDPSPRMSIPSIVLPSYRPDEDASRFLRKKQSNVTVSLPSLGEAAANDSEERSTSANGNPSLGSPDREARLERPEPPKVAFAEGEIVDSKSSMKSSATGNKNFSTHSMDIGHSQHNNQASSHASSNGSISAVKASRSFQQGQRQVDPAAVGSSSYTGILKGAGAVGNNSGPNYPQVHRATFPASRAAENTSAFALLEQTSFSKGRTANQFHHSEFDKTKASEYKHMLGNLNSIMDILSQQQTKSFRKSVEVKKPETPPKPKKKSKVSTMAIIFGREGKRSGKGKKSAGSSAKQKGGKKSANSSKGGKQRTGEKKNTLPVPTIKIN